MDSLVDLRIFEALPIAGLGSQSVKAAEETGQQESGRRTPNNGSCTLFSTHCASSTAQHSTAQHSTAQHSTAQHSTAQHSTAQHSTAQYSPAQPSAAQRSAAQRSTAQHSTSSAQAQAHLCSLIKAYRTLLHAIPRHGLVQAKQRLVVQAAAVGCMLLGVHLCPLHERSRLRG